MHRSCKKKDKKCTSVKLVRCLDNFIQQQFWWNKMSHSTDHAWPWNRLKVAKVQTLWKPTKTFAWFYYYLMLHFWCKIHATKPERVTNHLEDWWINNSRCRRSERWNLATPHYDDPCERVSAVEHFCAPVKYENSSNSSSLTFSLWLSRKLFYAQNEIFLTKQYCDERMCRNHCTQTNSTSAVFCKLHAWLRELSAASLIQLHCTF